MRNFAWTGTFPNLECTMSISKTKQIVMTEPSLITRGGTYASVALPSGGYLNIHFEPCCNNSEIRIALAGIVDVYYGEEK